MLEHICLHIHISVGRGPKCLAKAAVIRVINQSSYSCFLTFLQVVMEKLMKVKSVMVSSLASGKYDNVSISK